MTERKQFVATDEAKGQAKQLRLFAVLAWVLAMAGQVFAILKLIKDDKLTWLIVAIIVILALAITGSYLWKKANRLDPASEKDKAKFFIQNQLGAIMGVLAFLPLVIFIFTDKNASKQTKGVAGAVAVVAMLIAGISGADFNPPSVEKYTEQINAQTDEIKQLNNGVDLVYWTPSGNKYHINDDCQYIRKSKAEGTIGQGTVKEAWEERKIGDSELCAVCKRNAERNQETILENIQETIEEVTQE